MSLSRYLSKLGASLNSSGQVPAAGLASGAAVSNIGAGGVTSNELAAAVKPLGVSQTWQNVLGSRSVSTTYTNSTGRPIQLSIAGWDSRGGQSGFITVVIDGIVIGQSGAPSNSIYILPATTNPVVPSGSTYSVVSGEVGIDVVSLWSELR